MKFMRLYRKKRSIMPFVTAVLFLALITGVLLFVQTTSHRSEEQARLTVENSLKRAMVSCYAIEGSYPQSATYLEEKYGVVVDHERFLVDYQTIGSNIMPYLSVVLAGTNDFESMGDLE